MEILPLCAPIKMQILSFSTDRQAEVRMVNTIALWHKLQHSTVILRTFPFGQELDTCLKNYKIILIRDEEFP
jgi:hypothetical protein